MEYTSITIHVPRVQIETSRILATSRALAARLVAILRHWQNRRAQYLAIKQLYMLDDHMLKDIGLQRSQIESAVLTRNPNNDRKERHLCSGLMHQ